jgi:predicted transcriptional regulator
MSMAIPKIKATYSLDESTVRKLAEIARKWETSKSDALTRLINQGSQMSSNSEEIQRKLDALKRFQEANRHITHEQWEQFKRERKEMWRDPRGVEP